MIKIIIGLITLIFLTLLFYSSTEDKQKDKNIKNNYKIKNSISKDKSIQLPIIEKKQKEAIKQLSSGKKYILSTTYPMYEPNINKTSDTPFSEDERKNFEQSLIHKKQTNSKKIVFVNLNSKYRVHLSGKNKSSSKPLSLKMQKKILESMDIKKESKINEKSLSNNFSKIAQSL